MLDLVADQLGVEVEVVGYLLLPTVWLESVEDFVVEDCVQGHFLGRSVVHSSHGFYELFSAYLSVKGDTISHGDRGLSSRGAFDEVVMVRHILEFGQADGVGEEGLDSLALIVALQALGHSFGLS